MWTEVTCGSECLSPPLSLLSASCYSGEAELNLYVSLTYVQIMAFLGLWLPAIKNKDLDIIIRLCDLMLKAILSLKSSNPGLFG